MERFSELIAEEQFWFCLIAFMLFLIFVTVLLQQRAMIKDLLNKYRDIEYRRKEDFVCWVEQRKRLYVLKEEFLKLRIKSEEQYQELLELRKRKYDRDFFERIDGILTEKERQKITDECIDEFFNERETDEILSKFGFTDESDGDPRENEEVRIFQEEQVRKKDV